MRLKFANNRICCVALLNSRDGKKYSFANFGALQLFTADGVCLAIWTEFKIYVWRDDGAEPRDQVVYSTNITRGFEEMLGCMRLEDVGGHSIIYGCIWMQ